jgi:hypothetical protein
MFGLFTQLDRANHQLPEGASTLSTDPPTPE